MERKRVAYWMKNSTLDEIFLKEDYIMNEMRCSREKDV
jgi:hypothetical protein